MGYMKLCGNFYITPEPGKGLIPIVPHCFGPDHCSCLGSGSTQCEYIISDQINNDFTLIFISV